jgi:hypothetical protein
MEVIRMILTLDQWEEIHPGFAWIAFLQFPDVCTFTEFCETAYKNNWLFDKNGGYHNA